ncbi:MAG: FCD domain-containing protein, partial [Actinophytocola sp.]|nr:FCD domain-containing protein [Actinophytocola sp.]
VVEAGHNTLLTELHRGLTEAITASVATTTKTNLRDPTDIGHRGLLRAIAVRDPDRAVAEASGFLDELLALVPDKPG